MATTLVDWQHPAWQTVGGMLVSYLILLGIVTVVLFVIPFLLFTVA